MIGREAAREDVIPLSAPLTTQTGEVITGIPVSKGQRVTMSIAAYNRRVQRMHTWYINVIRL